MKMVTKLSIVLGLIATLVLSGCQKHETHEEMPHYAATTPFREDTSILEPYVCQIRAIRHIEVRSLEKGYLTHIFIDEGQWVKKGQPMFKIMPNVYQAELLTAEAEAQNMNIEYLNTKALADKNIVSANELALAKAKLDKANAQVNLAKTHLGFTDIKAPFDGITDHLAVRIGSLLDEDDLLTELSDIGHLWVYFNVPEAKYLDFIRREKGKTNEKGQLRMASGEFYEYTWGSVIMVGDFYITSGTIQFLDWLGHPVGVLRPEQP